MPVRETILREGPRIRRTILLALTVLVPLLFLRNLSDPINIPKLGLLITCVALVTAVRVAELLQTKDWDRLRLLAVPAVALGAPLLVGWAFSPYKGWALWGVYPRMLGLLPYLVVILFGVLLADTFRGEASTVAWALAGAGGVAGAYAILQFFGLDPFEWTVKGTETSELVVATLGNPNFAGAFFAIVLPLGLTLFLLVPERRVLAGGTTVLILMGMILAGSEAAWAAGLAGVAVVMGFFLVPRWRFARLAAAGVVLAIVVVVAGSVVLAMADVAESKIPATIQRRAEWWEAAVDMATASPLVGRGPNAFALEHPQYRTAEDVAQVGLDITDDPHSVFLSFLTAAGALGALGYLVVVGWVVRSARATPGDALLAGGFLGAITAYFVQSLVSIDTVALRVAGWTALAGFAAARAPALVAKAKSKSQKKKAAREPLRGLPALPVLLLLAVAGIWVGAQLILKDATFRHAGNLLQDGKGQAALVAYESSVSFNGNPHYRRAYGRLLGQVAVAGGTANGEPFIERARESFDFVHHLPQVHAALDYAETLKNWAEIDASASAEAADTYLLAASYDPMDPAALSEAASGLRDLAAHDKVIALLEPVVTQLDDAELWGQLALAQAESGDRSAAEASLARALALNPSGTAAQQAQTILEERAPGS